MPSYCSQTTLLSILQAYKPLCPSGTLCFFLILTALHEGSLSRML